MVPYSGLQRGVGWTLSSAAPAPGIELALRGIGYFVLRSCNTYNTGSAFGRAAPTKRAICAASP